MPASPRKAASPAKKEKVKKDKVKKDKRKRKDGKLFKKADYSSYSSYIHKLLALEAGQTKKGGKTRTKVAITSRGMGVMNAFVVDLFERLAEEAGRASQFAGMQTLRSGALTAAVKMHLPKDMAEHALKAAVGAVSHYAKALKEKESTRPKRSPKKSRK